MEFDFVKFFSYLRLTTDKVHWNGTLSFHCATFEKNMDFEIKRTTTVEFPDTYFKVDLNDLESFISEKLTEKHYGNSVIKYFWGFELFKFDGGFAQFFRNDIESWKHSVKWLVTNSNFDWNIIKDLTELQTLELIKKEMLISIGRINNMKRKPKDFEYEKLIQDLDVILSDFIKIKKTLHNTGGCCTTQ